MDSLAHSRALENGATSLTSKVRRVLAISLASLFAMMCDGPVGIHMHAWFRVTQCTELIALFVVKDAL